MSDVQLHKVSKNIEEQTTTPDNDPKISSEQTSKRRALTSPPALEMNSLPLPKSAKKSPIRTRLAGSRFESGEWSVNRSKQPGQPIKASFASPAIRVPVNSQRAIEPGDEAIIDRALALAQDFEKNQSI